MANTTENIYVKMNIDTSGFNSSLAGIKKELTGLKGLVGNNLLSAQDQQAVLTRMGDLKGQMEDLTITAKNMDLGDGFQNVAQLGGVAAGAVGGVTAAMSLLGIESKATEDIEKKLLITIQLASTFQQLADAKRLAGMVRVRAAQLANLLTFKAATVATAEQAVATTVLAGAETAAAVGATEQNVATGALATTQTVATKSTGLITKAQLLWNAAITANPIGLIIVAVAALAAGIYLLTKAFDDSSESAEAYDKSLSELNNTIDDYNKDKRAKEDDLNNQRKVALGQMTQDDYDAWKSMTESSREYYKKQEEFIIEWKKTRDAEIAHLKDEGASDKFVNEAIKKDQENLNKYLGIMDKNFYDQQAFNRETNAILKRNEEKKEREAEFKRISDAEKAFWKSQTDMLLQEQIKRKENEAKLRDLGEKPKATLLNPIKKGFDGQLKADFDMSKLYAENDLQLSKDILNQKLTAQEEYMKRKLLLLQQDLRNQQDAGKDTIALEKEIVDAQIELQNMRKDEQNKNREEIFQYARLGLQTFSDFATTIMDANLSAMQTIRDNQLKAATEAKENTIAQLDTAIEYGLISQEAYNVEKLKAEEEFAAKEKALKKAQYDQEKKVNISKAIMGTAMAVLNGLQTQPFVPLGIIMGAVAAALGAVQVAAIANAPVPTFAAGGYINGSSHSMGGTMINAEGGEYIINKSSTQRLGTGFLNKLNNPNQNTGSIGSNMDASTIQNIVSATIAGISSIPVVNVESESTKVQRKVTNIEAKASW